MTDWSPDDYYRASRQARAAWQVTQPQLTLCGLDDVPLTALETAGSTPTRETRTGDIIEPARFNPGGAQPTAAPPPVRRASPTPMKGT